MSKELLQECDLIYKKNETVEISFNFNIHKSQELVLVKMINVYCVYYNIGYTIRTMPIIKVNVFLILTGKKDDDNFYWLCCKIKEWNWDQIKDKCIELLLKGGTEFIPTPKQQIGFKLC
jgi:hypothetical protein